MLAAIAELLSFAGELVPGVVELSSWFRSSVVRRGSLFCSRADLRTTGCLLPIDAATVRFEIALPADARVRIYRDADTRRGEIYATVVDDDRALLVPIAQREAAMGQGYALELPPEHSTRCSAACVAKAT